MKNELLEKARSELDDQTDLDNLAIGVVVGTIGGLLVWLGLIWSFGG
jgi:hypothetical protein